MAENEFLIHELAERAAVTVRTIRYYVDEGLLSEPVIRGKYAYYTSEHLARLKLIQELKDLHLPLREIREAINSTGDAKVRERLENSALPGPETTPPSSSPQEAPNPGSGALDYIARIKNTHSVLREPSTPQNSNASHPVPSLPNPNNAATQLHGGETWRHMRLAPGVDLHLQEPIDPDREAQIQQIIEFARKTFQHPSKGGKHEPK